MEVAWVIKFEPQLYGPTTIGVVKITGFRGMRENGAQVWGVTFNEQGMGDGEYHVSENEFRKLTSRARIERFGEAVTFEYEAITPKLDPVVKEAVLKAIRVWEEIRVKSQTEYT